ncbi:MAG: preprotein translocase subunit YajC, partial [Oscillospiraceae bacterium]|nr:preprotein translocase subunit YajC [Oscillospiraceae bacterium]
MLCIQASAESTGSAANAGQTGSIMLLQMVPFAIALVLLYLILLRPQQKREKTAQAMRENVRVGDEVCTAGGIVGIVLKVEDETVVLETGAERNRIRVKKWAIQENITQMEEMKQAEKERKAARRNGIATAAASDDGEKKKKK